MKFTKKNGFLPKRRALYSFYIDSPVWQQAVAKTDSSIYSEAVILTE